MEADTMTPAAKDDQRMVGSDKTSTPPAGGTEQQERRKRSASTTLERSPIKVAKASDGGENSREGSVAAVVTTANGDDDKEATGDSFDWKTKHDELRGKAIDATRRLKREKQRLEDERDEVRGEKAELEEEIVNLQAKLKANKGGESSKQMAKRIEEDIKKKYEKKHSDQQSKHEQKMTDQQAKHEQILEQQTTKLKKIAQKKYDELKDKLADAEQAAKDAKIECSQKVKDTKAEYSDLKKQLRAEQQAEIKKYKPENQAEIKEKKDVIKSYEKKISAHEKAVKAHGEELGEMQAKIDLLEKFKKKAHERIRELQEGIAKEKTFTSNLGVEYGAKTNELESKLVEEGKRWEKMRECRDELHEKLVMQQRTNFMLRQRNESDGKKIDELRNEVQTLKGAESGSASQQAAASVGARVEVGTQTSDSGSPESIGREFSDAAKDGTPKEQTLDEFKDYQRTMHGAVGSTTSLSSTTPTAGSHQASTPTETANTPIRAGSETKEMEERAKSIASEQTGQDIVPSTEKADSPIAQPGTAKENEDQIPPGTDSGSEAMDIDSKDLADESTSDQTGAGTVAVKDKHATSAVESDGDGDGAGEQRTGIEGGDEPLDIEMDETAN